MRRDCRRQPKQAPEMEPPCLRRSTAERREGVMLAGMEGGGGVLGFGILIGDKGEKLEQKGALTDAGAFAEGEGVEGFFGSGVSDAVTGFLKGSHPGVAHVEGIAEFFAEVAESLEVGGEGVDAGLAEVTGDETFFEVVGFEGNGLRGVGSHGVEVGGICRRVASFVSNFERRGKLFAAMEGQVGRFVSLVGEGFCGCSA